MLPDHRRPPAPRAPLVPGVATAASSPRFEHDIAQAHISVNISEYIWEPGLASEQLVRALSARTPGVACRVLADALGSPDFEKKVAPALRKSGCEARVFRPLAAVNLLERNHRKLVVIDGSIAYLGGFGVRDEWLSKRCPRWSPLKRKRMRMSGELAGRQHPAGRPGGQ